MEEDMVDMEEEAMVVMEDMEEEDMVDMEVFKITIL